MGRVSDARARLLDSAAALINARSYAAVGVQELCVHAGVNKGSFYYFFPSKESLTVAALDRQWQSAREHLLEQAFTPSLPPLERIRRFVALHGEGQRAAQAETGRAPGCCFGNLAVELSTQSELVRAQLERIFSEQAALIEQALREAVADGDLELTDPAEAALAVQGYVQGLMVLAKLRNDPALLTRLAHRVFELLDAPAAGAVAVGQR